MQGLEIPMQDPLSPGLGPVVLMRTCHKLPRLHGFEGNTYGTPSFTCAISSLEGASPLGHFIHLWF